MRLITWTAFAVVALALSISSSASARGSLVIENQLATNLQATRLALNPQPEPPNKNRKNKIKKGDPGTKRK